MIDNPSDQEIGVEVSGELHTVPPGSETKVSITSGECKIKLAGKDTTVQVSEDGGLINAGGKEYVIWKLLYGVQKDKDELLNERKVDIDSSTYTGDITLIPASQIYIPKDWELGLDEKLPDRKTLMIVEDYQVVSKIFRKEDFRHTYNQMASGN